jgi:hypothetical protein
MVRLNLRRLESDFLVNLLAIWLVSRLIDSVNFRRRHFLAFDGGA